MVPVLMAGMDRFEGLPLFVFFTDGILICTVCLTFCKTDLEIFFGIIYNGWIIIQYIYLPDWQANLQIGVTATTTYTIPVRHIEDLYVG
jgi:hypothetical protein